MIATTANFDAAAALIPSKPVYRFSVYQYSKVFVYRKTGRLNENAWIASIGDWGVTVDPQNGSYTIDDLVVNIVDMAAAITADLGLFLLEGRDYVLQMGFDGLALEDYCTLSSGIVNTVTSNGDSTYAFTCNDYQRLNQRLIYTTGNTGTVTTTQTTYNAASPYTIITRVDTTNPVTGVVTTTAAATYAVNGPTGPTGTFKSTVNGVAITGVVTSRVITGTGGGNFTVYETVTTSVGFNSTTTVTETYGAVALYTNVIVTTVTNQAMGTVVTTLNVTYTENGVLGLTTVSDNSIISSSNPRILNGHPLDMMLEILLTEIGYATGDINIAQIEAYRDTVFTGVEFYFVITGSVDAKDFMESQLLKPLGGYLFPNALGQLCVGFAQPLTGGLAPVGAITPANLVGPNLPAINAAPLVNVVSIRFDKNDSSTATNTTISNTGYLAQADTFYTPTIQDLTDLSGQVAQEAATGAGAVQGQLIIESDGMRSGFQGFLLAKMVSNSLFAKYGFYNPTIQASTHWAGLFKAEIGEYLTVTHPLLPNRKLGVMGITNQLFQVVGRSYSFDAMTVTFKLEDASGVQAFGAYRIAPDYIASAIVEFPSGVVDEAVGPMPVYTAATAYEKGRYLFMANTSGNQSTAVAAGTLG